MIDVSQALEITLQQTPSLATERVPLLQAHGRVLAEAVTSDLDMPPFDRSAMDGYAVKSADVQNAPVELKVTGFVPAGTFPEFTLQRGEAAKIMTGAPLPRGADSVQMVEKTESAGDHTVRILAAVEPGKHISRRGEILQEGQTVLQAGTYLSPAAIGLLATVGREEVSVYRRPSVAILVTGDELVDVGEKPTGGQIRNSNAYALYHQVRQTGCEARLLGVARDNVADLTGKIAAGLQEDVLLVSGGVSMGDLDLVEDVFAGQGVDVFFDKVAIKPGKPTVFGRRGATLVFGLPGNPVSASTVFEVFVRPALRKLMGFASVQPLLLEAELRGTLKSKTRRTYYAPARAYVQDGRLFAEALPSKGSADVLAFARSNAYAIVPSEVDELRSGQAVTVFLRQEFFATVSETL